MIFECPRIANSKKFNIQHHYETPPLDRKFILMERFAYAVSNKLVGKWISLSDTLHFWFVENNIDYKISYNQSNGILIDISDNNDAMFFKLTWGGK